MDLKHITSFVTVAQQKSFSKAADLLFLSQPAISSNIQKLEKELGITLFDRKSNAISLTSGGVLFYGYAMDILNMCKKAELAVKEHKNTIGGTLKIYASSIPEQHLLPYIVKDFIELYPDVQFSIRHKDSKDVVGHVLSGKINLGFVGAKYDCQALEYVDFYQDRLVMIASPEKNFEEEILDLETLAGESFILREEGSGTRLLVERALKKKGLGLDIFENRTISDSMETIVKLVELNVGLSFVSELAVECKVKMGMLRKYEIEDMDFTRSFSLIHCKNRCLSPTEECFKEFVSTWSYDSIKQPTP